MRKQNMFFVMTFDRHLRETHKYRVLHGHIIFKWIRLRDFEGKKIITAIDVTRKRENLEESLKNQGSDSRP